MRKLELENPPSVETLMDLVTNLYRQGGDSKAQPYLDQVFLSLRTTAESGKYDDVAEAVMSADPLLEAMIEGKKTAEAETLFRYLLRILDNGMAAGKTDEAKK